MQLPLPSRHQILWTEPLVRTSQPCRLWHRCLKIRRKAWGTAVLLEGVKEKRHFILVLSLACLIFAFRALWRQNAVPGTIFLILRGTFGLILRVGFMHFAHLLLWPWVSSSVVADSLWQGLLVLPSHFLSLLSACYAKRIKILFQNTILLPWQPYPHYLVCLWRMWSYYVTAVPVNAYHCLSW